MKKEDMKQDKKFEVPESVNTRLLDKNYSPLIVRKYQMFGWPLFIGMICDASLSDLDMVVNEFTNQFGKVENDIQEARNYCGGLSDYIAKHYNNVRDNVAYPSVLFLTGANDPRVDPMHSRKMTACLQEASSSGMPVLLRTSSKTGHGLGTPLSEQINKSVHYHAFLFNELGL